MPLGFNVSHGVTLAARAGGGAVPRWIAQSPRHDAQHSKCFLYFDYSDIDLAY
jgi:hypothetical protein